MLYFIYGSDTIASFEKAKTLLDSMQKKRPNAALFKLNTENWNNATLQELVEGQGLFDNKYIVMISRVLEQKEISGVVLEMLEEIKESPHVFIWVEEDVDAKTLKQVEKHAEKVQECVAREKSGKPVFNIFALTDALGNRDKKKLWILYQEALEQSAPEEIHGTLMWQMKSMMLALKAKTPADSGLKPFVYTKSKRFAANFEPAELQSLSFSLATLPAEIRRGNGEFDLELEKFILAL